MIHKKYFRCSSFILEINLCNNNTISNDYYCVLCVNDCYSDCKKMQIMCVFILKECKMQHANVESVAGVTIDKMT